MIYDKMIIGCSRLEPLSAPISIKTAVTALRRAIEEGVTHFDAAAIYGRGDSEAAASIFSTSGCVNSTLLAEELSLRLGAYMRKIITSCVVM